MLALFRKMLGASPPENTSSRSVEKLTADGQTALGSESVVTLSGDNFLKYIEDRISRQLLAKLAAGVFAFITLAGTGAFLLIGDMWKDAAKRESEKTLELRLPSELARTLVFTEPVKNAFDDALKKQEALLRERAQKVIDESLSSKKIEDLVTQSLERSSGVAKQIAARYKAVAKDSSTELSQRQVALQTLVFFAEQDEVRNVIEEILSQPAPTALKILALRLYKPTEGEPAAAERILRTAIQDSNSEGESDLSSAYTTCIASFKKDAVAALSKALRDPQTGKHLSLVAKAFAKIGTLDSLENLVSLVEQQESVSRSVGWQALADFRISSEIDFEKRKDAIRRSFKIARSAETTPTNSIRVDSDSVSRLDDLRLLERALRAPQDEMLLMLSLYRARSRISQRDLPVMREPISTRALRNLLGTPSLQSWTFLADSFWPSTWVSLEAVGNSELVLAIWLPLREAAKQSKDGSKIASGLLDRLLSMPDPLSRASARQGIILALEDCTEDSVKTFFSRFLTLVRGGAVTTLEGAKHTGAAALLSKAIERDDRMNPRFAQVRRLIHDWKKGGRDWAIGADIAASLATPIAAGEVEAQDYLFECIRPPIKEDPSRWPASYNALSALKNCNDGALPTVAEKILSFVGSLEGIDGKKNAKGEHERLHEHVVEAENVLNALARRSPRLVLDKIFQTVQTLRPPGEAVGTVPGLSEARHHLTRVLGRNGYALAIPTTSGELLSGFDEDDWRNAEANLISLSERIREVVPVVPPNPQKMSSLVIEERQRASSDWTKWWDAANAATTSNLDKIISLAQGEDDLDVVEEDEEKPETN